MGFDNGGSFALKFTLNFPSASFFYLFFFFLIKRVIVVHRVLLPPSREVARLSLKPRRRFTATANTARWHLCVCSVPIPCPSPDAKPSPSLRAGSLPADSEGKAPVGLRSGAGSSTRAERSRATASTSPPGTGCDSPGLRAVLGSDPWRVPVLGSAFTRAPWVWGPWRPTAALIYCIPARLQLIISLSS